MGGSDVGARESVCERERVREKEGERESSAVAPRQCERERRGSGPHTHTHTHAKTARTHATRNTLHCNTLHVSVSPGLVPKRFTGAKV